jgi:hypothetical protein
MRLQANSEGGSIIDLDVNIHAHISHALSVPLFRSSCTRKAFFLQCKAVLKPSISAQRKCHFPARCEGDEAVHVK